MVGGRAKAIKNIRVESKTACDFVIFEDELSPAQGRNLQFLVSRKVLDRTQLILDTRAARAQPGRAPADRARAVAVLFPR